MNKELTEQWVYNFQLAVKRQKEKVRKIEKELDYARLSLEALEGQLKSLEDQIVEL